MARSVSSLPTGRRSASVERTRTSMKSSGVRSGSGWNVTVGTALTLRRKRRLYHTGDGLGVLVAPLPQGPDDFLAALGGVVLVQLPLAFDPLDLDAEADDLRQHSSRERPGAVERPGAGHGLLVDAHRLPHDVQQGTFILN